jgi:hypothetical protein
MASDDYSDLTSAPPETRSSLVHRNIASMNTASMDELLALTALLSLDGGGTLKDAGPTNSLAGEIAAEAASTAASAAGNARKAAAAYAAFEAAADAASEAVPALVRDLEGMPEELKAVPQKRDTDTETTAQPPRKSHFDASVSSTDPGLLASLQRLRSVVKSYGSVDGDAAAAPGENSQHFKQAQAGDDDGSGDDLDGVALERLTALLRAAGGEAREGLRIHEDEEEE